MVTFTATRGSNMFNDIGLDDVYISNNTCTGRYLYDVYISNNTCTGRCNFSISLTVLSLQVKYCIYIPS